MLKKISKKQEGFTIIEVLIVLAIAGLIMVMVFVAVPNLQRNQRNSGRRQDATHLLTAASNYITNNNGVPPAANTTNEQQILGDGGPYANLTSLSAGAGTETNLTTNKLIILNGAQTLSTANLTSASAQAAAVVTRATCNTSTLGATSNGAGQEVAVVYTLEAGSGTVPQLACIHN